MTITPVTLSVVSMLSPAAAISVPGSVLCPPGVPEGIGALPTSEVSHSCSQHACTEGLLCAGRDGPSASREMNCSHLTIFLNTVKPFSFIN